MKTFLSFCLLLNGFASCAQVSTSDSTDQQYDVSTNEKVIAVLTQIKGVELEKRDLCIQRETHFEDLVIVAFFAHDKGCMGDHIFYKGQYVSTRNHAQQIFKDHDWGQQNKEKLAMQYTQEVLLAWETVLTQYASELQEDFGDFHPPKITTTEQQEIEIILWVREPVGMLPQNEYYKARILFDSDGNFVSMKRLKSTIIKFSEK